MKLTTIIKTTISTFCICFFLASIANAAPYVSVVKDGVNVRTGPSTQDPVSWELFKDYPLKVVENKGEWIKVVDFEGDGGWIYAPLTRKGNSAIVTAKKSVNMRSEPTTAKKNIVANVERGVVLIVLDQKDGTWTKVKHEGGTVGWISNQFLWPR